MKNTDLLFEFIDISGFMSFSPKRTQRLILNTNRLTTIIGENLDVGDGERNGVGKSAIIDAILYLFFGKTPRVSNQGFLNYVDPGTMFVVGEASRNGISFRVERGENPSVLRLFEKDDDDTREFRHKEDSKLIFEATKSTKPETTRRIIELLGFDLKLSDVLLVNNPSDRSCFFLKTEEDQRNIIERIFGFTVFTEKADNLREMRKEETRNLATKESAFIATKQANDRVAAEIQQLEEKANAWAAERDGAVKKTNHLLRSYEKIDFGHEITVLTALDELVKELDQIDREIAMHDQGIQSTQQRHSQWEQEHQEKLNSLSATLEMLQKADSEGDIKIIRKADDVKAKILEAKTEANTAKQDHDLIKRQMETEHQNKSRIQKQVEIIEKQIIELNESKCPTCGQDWEDTKDHIVHCIADLDTHTREIADIDTLIREYTTIIETSRIQHEKSSGLANKLINDLTKLTPVTFRTIEEATRASANLAETMKKLDDLKGSKNPHNAGTAEIQKQLNMANKKRDKIIKAHGEKPDCFYTSLTEAEKEQRIYEQTKTELILYQKAINPYRETIDNLREKVMKVIDDTEIRELKKKIDHMSLLIKLLSDRDSPIRTSILHEWLPELNERANNYLEALELPHKMTFDANMTATFTLNQRELTFGNLSTGQRLRVWLATNLAFREIFELINYNINLFFIDEVLDKGMSARGAEVSYRLLEQMVEQNKSLFLISHRAELCDMSDHTLIIQLENGLSTILNS